MVKVRKRSLKSLPIARRAVEGLTCNDWVRLKGYMIKYLKTRQCILMFEKDSEVRKLGELLSTLILREIGNIWFVERPIIIGNERQRKFINSLTQAEINTTYRFKSDEQLLRLLTGFKIPQKISLPNGSSISGEEALLIALDKLAR